MQNTKDMLIGDKIKALVYGVSKSGKTWGALTFPRPLVFDFDQGVMTARHPEFVKKYGMKDILYERFVDVANKHGIVEKPKAFDDACLFLDEMLKSENVDKFDTIIVDSGTTLSEIAMNKAVVILGKENLSKSHADSKLHGLLVPKMQDYGAERSLLEQFIDEVKKADKHVIIICHEKQILTKEGVLVNIVPLLTGKSVESVPLKFDEVWNLQMSGTAATRKRSLTTEFDGIRKCGSRMGIPNETPFEWDAISKVIAGLRAAQTQKPS